MDKGKFTFEPSVIIGKNMKIVGSLVGGTLHY